jgi:phage terminase small subunit
MVRRPVPPAHLGDEAQAIWRATVNSVPADWFPPGTRPLLEALCGLAVSQQYALRALQRIESGEEQFDQNRWERLQKQLGEVSGRVATLATRLRLTPQSRYGPRSAATAARGNHDGPKPWET